MSNVINDQNKRCKSHTDLSGSITMSFEVLEIRQGKELAAAKESIDVPTVEVVTGC